MFITFLLFFSAPFVFLWYMIVYRGIYHVSKNLTNIIENFLNDPECKEDFNNNDYYYRYFTIPSKNTRMKIWSANYPYAYGSRGEIYNKNECVYKWKDKNIHFFLRRRIYNM